MLHSEVGLLYCAVNDVDIHVALKDLKLVIDVPPPGIIVLTDEPHDRGGGRGVQIIFFATSVHFSPT